MTIEGKWVPSDQEDEISGLGGDLTFQTGWLITWPKDWSWVGLAQVTMAAMSSWEQQLSRPEVRVSQHSSLSCPYILPAPSSTMFAETEFLTKPGVHRFFSAGKPARLKVPFVSTSLEWDYRCMVCSTFYMGTGNMGSSPHVWLSCSLLAETFLRPAPQTLLDSIGIYTAMQSDGPWFKLGGLSSRPKHHSLQLGLVVTDNSTSRV